MYNFIYIDVSKLFIRVSIFFFVKRPETPIGGIPVRPQRRPSLCLSITLLVKMATSILRLPLRLSARNAGILSRNTGLKTSNISRSTQGRTIVSTPSGAILPKPDKVSFIPPWLPSEKAENREEIWLTEWAGLNAGLTAAVANSKAGYAPRIAESANQRMFTQT